MPSVLARPSASIGKGGSSAKSPKPRKPKSSRNQLCLIIFSIVLVSLLSLTFFMLTDKERKLTRKINEFSKVVLDNSIRSNDHHKSLRHEGPSGADASHDSSAGSSISGSSSEAQEVREKTTVKTEEPDDRSSKDADSEAKRSADHGDNGTSTPKASDKKDEDDDDDDYEDKGSGKKNHASKDDQSSPSEPLPDKLVCADQPAFNAESKQIHFIHIPKCGGTSMTALLRNVQCNFDPQANQDCCTNPGFCDWHAMRRCNAIQGCINHFPNRRLIFKPMPSITVLREPISRLLSAFFYRGHSPNLDFFQVRPYFKDIADGKLPKVTFQEYIEMPEYQNIITRMLGADSFPYRNITITDEVFRKAVDSLNHIFFVGLQEEYERSVYLLVKMMNSNISTEVPKERDQSFHSLKLKKQELKDNVEIMTRAKELNHYDIKLYNLAVQKYCCQLRKFPEYFQEAQLSGKIKCPDSQN